MRQLHQGLLGKARLQGDPDGFQRLHVLLVEQVGLVAEPRCLEEPLYRPGVHAENPGHLGERADRSDAAREHHLDVAGEEPLLLLGPRDRVEADPSSEEQLDQAYPLHVFGPERLRRFAADEPERAPLAELIRRRRRQLGKLLQGQLVPHRYTRVAWAIVGDTSLPEPSERPRNPRPVAPPGRPPARWREADRGRTLSAGPLTLYLRPGCSFTGMRTEQAHRIGDVARAAGVNVETLRYYERRGLLRPSRALPEMSART